MIHSGKIMTGENLACINSLSINIHTGNAMKSQKLFTALLLILPGVAFAADPLAVIPEPSILGLIVAGAAVGALVYRNRRK